MALEVTQYPLNPKAADILNDTNREWARLGKQPAYALQRKDPGRGR
jgi:hypothetical protein